MRVFILLLVEKKEVCVVRFLVLSVVVVLVLVYKTCQQCVRGRYFQDGEEIKMNMSIEAAYRRAIEAVVDYVNTQVIKDKTRVFFRTYSPDHFRFEFFFPCYFCDENIIYTLVPSRHNS